MAVEMVVDFYDLYWHDAIHNTIEIVRSNNGYSIILEIDWPDGQLPFMKFDGALWANLNFNLEFIGNNSISDADILDLSDRDVVNFFKSYSDFLVKGDLHGYYIKSNDRIKIIANDFKLFDGLLSSGNFSKYASKDQHHDFYDLPWIDAIINNIRIKRIIQGERDIISLEIKWPHGEICLMTFEGVYCIKMRLNSFNSSQVDKVAILENNDDRVTEFFTGYKGHFKTLNLVCYSIQSDINIIIIAKGFKIFKIDKNIEC